MTYHARLNWVMAITLFGVIVFLYVMPHSTEVQEYSISAMPSEAVQHIRILTQHREVVLHRTEYGWFIVQPVSVAADENKVRKMLEILKAKSSHRFSRENLGDFGLNQPNLQLFLDDEHFSFGGFASTTLQQYLATRDHVYLISPHYALAVPVDVQALINPAQAAVNR